MSPIYKLLASTALVACMSMPVQALTLDNTATIALYTAGMVPSADADDDSTGPASGDGATSAPTADSTLNPDDPVFESTDDSTGPATGDDVESAPEPSTTTATESEVTEDTSDDTGAATGDNVASDPALNDVESLATVRIENSGFMANNVVDSAGAPIGVVEDVIRMEDNRTTLVVLTNGGMIGEGRFTVSIDPSLTADGVVQLYLSENELVAALAAL